MHTITCHIDDILNKKIEAFAKEHDRSKAYVIRKAIESYIADQSDLKLGKLALDEFYNTGFKTYSLKDVKEENDL